VDALGFLAGLGSPPQDRKELGGGGGGRMDRTVLDTTGRMDLTCRGVPSSSALDDDYAMDMTRHGDATMDMTVGGGGGLSGGGGLGGGTYLAGLGGLGGGGGLGDNRTYLHSSGMDITCATVDNRTGQSASSGLRIAFTDRAVFPDADGERDKESGGGHYDDNVSFDGGATATMKFRQGPRIEGFVFASVLELDQWDQLPFGPF
jgi:hypothetical protein